MDIAHSPPKINSFCLNTVLVPYKMMIAVVLSFRLNRTVKKLAEPNTLSYQTLGRLLQHRLIPFDQTLYAMYRSWYTTRWWWLWWNAHTKPAARLSIRKSAEPNTVVPNVWSLATTQINFLLTEHCKQCTKFGTLQDVDGCGEMPTLSKQQEQV